MSRVELVRRARQKIVDLDWPLSDAVIEVLGLLEREPEAGHSLRGRLRGLRSLRVGACRVIYQLDDDERVVCVLAVVTGPSLTRPIHAEAEWTHRAADELPAQVREAPIRVLAH